MGNKKQFQKTINATKKQRRTTKKEKLLRNPDVQRWHDNLARGSKVTADVRLRRMGLFCEQHYMTPMGLIRIGQKDTKAVTDLLQDQISIMEEKGKAPQYIKSTMTAVKSWLSHFDIEIKRKLKITNVNSTPTLINERVPEGDELSELFSRADLRQGAIMALIGKAGLRPEVLGDSDATDGLVIQDLPELAIIKGLATFTASTPMVTVRQNLSKAGHEYFSFLTEIGAKQLLAYLNDRILAGDSLAPDSPIIGLQSKYNVYRGKNSGKKFLCTSVIGKEVRKAMRPRFQWRPYVLRAFFDTQLLIAESRGKIAHDFRVFFMGHTGSMEAKYTTNKSILPKVLLDEMRDAFKRSEEFLDPEKVHENPIEKRKEAVKENIEKLTPEQLADVQVLVNNLTNCNTVSR